MANIKTAISIEKPIFEQMNVLAKDLNISRSRLFAYDDLPESEPIVSKMRPRHFKRVKEQW
jgi:hypothetical protein